MKKSIFILALLLSLAGCSSAEHLEESSDSQAASGAAISAPAVSAYSAPMSSKAESAPESTPSESPASSEPETSSEAPSSVPDTSAHTSSQCPASSEAPPASSEAPPSSTQASQPAPSEAAPSSQLTAPEGRRPMTEAEVDEVIAEAIAYAESKGMTWYEDFSIEKSGYYLPANSTEGIDIFRRDLFYKVDFLYELSTTESYYKEGNPIYYKIVKGPIEDMEDAWFGYVLY